MSGRYSLLARFLFLGCDMQIDRMVGDRVLVRVNEKPRSTRSGIVLPDKSLDLQPRFGVAVNVGLLMTPEGLYAPCVNVRDGETLLLPPRGGMEIDCDGDRLMVFDSSDVLAVVK